MYIKATLSLSQSSAIVMAEVTALCQDGELRGVGGTAGKRFSRRACSADQSLRPSCPCWCLSLVGYVDPTSAGPAQMLGIC